MNRNSKNLIISLTAAIFFSLIFVLVADGKAGITKFDAYLGMIWVFFLSFIVALSLTHVFKKDEK